MIRRSSPATIEGVAVECDQLDVGVVDDLVPGLILGRVNLARLPQLGEARAVGGQLGDQPLELAVGGIAGRGHAQVGDEQGFEAGLLLGRVDGAVAGAERLRHTPLRSIPRHDVVSPISAS